MSMACARMPTAAARRDAGTNRRALRLGHRIWIEDNEAKALSPDACELLARVATTGSLRQAALQAGVSYSKARHLAGDAEACLGLRLLDRRIGGSHGGGSAPTAACRDIGRRFAAFLREADDRLLELFEKHFADTELVGGLHSGPTEPSSLAVE
jgi:molybdate transport system regulatory protein